MRFSLQIQIIFEIRYRVKKNTQPNAFVSHLGEIQLGGTFEFAEIRQWFEKTSPHILKLRVVSDGAQIKSSKPKHFGRDLYVAKQTDNDTGMQETIVFLQMSSTVCSSYMQTNIASPVIIKHISHHRLR